MLPAASPLFDQLPLFQMRDFDILLNQSWPVGIESDYPSELRTRLSAASISYQMGNKSIDRVVERYFKDLTYEQSSTDRLDKRIARFLKKELSQLDRTLGELAPEKAALGQMVSKWTFMRLPFSFDFAITCAQRGALFECLAIVRMILEQMAWSLDIRLLDDFNEITSRRASQSIRAIKSIHPAAGLFYGWLSDHAHWAYGAHIKAFESTDETIGMRLASSLYKAQALGAILVLFIISQQAYRCLFEALGCTPPPVGERVDTEMNPYSFIHELQSLAPADKDIRHLVKMTEPKRNES
jgi:hypothetical protein